jgi:hypothetical protein
MSILASGIHPLDDSEDDADAYEDGRPNMSALLGAHETHWETVAQTPGLAAAEIMVGRLQAEGIPARAWQEGAGRALGLTVGLLGTGHVQVPAQLAEQAREILADESDEEE